ncbi:hypothetical protein P3X46_005895 [Hevea brasiliensis]|uniref:DUF4005 domain-containing protein n=1 Tax=Hevea brasiliensis TaxID=3981 RepID=A0ABQ9MPG7_HEVBR|nr:uncharacterized protein LOC131179092 [Hevea brasiliensis]KAJ9181848.1 hypothetical protein P3X46_005895 [Hevea brasiliensis]
MEEFREARWRHYNEDKKFEDRPRSGSLGDQVKTSVTKVEPPLPPPPPPPPRRSHRYSKSTGSTWNQNKKANTYSSSWSFNDPEVKRQRRVAKYKSYAVEGKMKASLRESFRWFKNKWCSLVHGY